jgi:hypothetical protein
MKKALLLIGNVRTWEHCKENFKKTYGDMDIFISTYDLKYGYHPAVKSTISDYDDEVITKEQLLDWFSDLNLIDLNFECHIDNAVLISEEDAKLHPNLQNIHSSFAQYRKLKLATDMVKKYEEDNNFKYDVLIRARFDLMYNSVDFPVSSDELICNNISGDPDSEFLGDHFFMCSRDNMIKISEFIYSEFYSPVYDDSHLSPPHGLLRNSIRYNNLRKTPKNIVSYLLRKNGIQLIL